MEESNKQYPVSNEDKELRKSTKQFMKEMEIPNVFIIGAGFSAQAGLPLAKQLFEQIQEEAGSESWMKETMDFEYEQFMNYIYDTFDSEDADTRVNNIEDFISFLDVEHFLSLRGSDTWSSVGNMAQIIIRNLICKILFRAMTQISKEQFELYIKFAERLKPQDVVITFNYDTLLEEALSYIQKRFRFHPLGDFPPVYNEKEDVIILKMHGSINWFDKTDFDNFNKSMAENEYFVQSLNIVFNDPKRIITPAKIFKYVYFKGSPLRNVYQIGEVKEYLQRVNYNVMCPLIISPSYTKIVYLNPLKDLWYAFNELGIINETMAIIGFSLPPHDDYLRLPIYRLVHNFQHIECDDFRKKKNLKIVDLKRNKEEIDEYKRTYSFVDWDKTDTYFGGFNEEAVDMIFETR